MKTKSLKKALLLTLALWVGAGASSEAASLSLREAVDMALAQNTGLAIQEKEEDTARAELKSARGGNSVAITATGNVSDSRANGESNASSATGRLSATLPLYTAGKNEARIKSGEIGIDVARLKTERKREDVRFSVVKAYYNVLESKRKVEINTASVEKYKAHLADVEQRYRAGSKARLDVLRSSVELSNAQQTLIKSQNAYEVDIVKLKTLLRMPQQEPLTLTDEVSFAPFAPSMESCVTYAFENRKDLRVDAYKLRQQELAVDVARAGYMPQLNLNAGVGGVERFQPNRQGGSDYSASLQLSWNVFDNGVTQAAVDKAKTALEVAELTLRQDREKVDESVRQAYYNMREAEKRFVSTAAAVGEAEENYFITTEKYRAGQGILLDVIDAQDALSRAQLDYAGAQYDYARYRAEVENTTGLSLGETESVIDPKAKYTPIIHTPRRLPAKWEGNAVVDDTALEQASETAVAKAQENMAAQTEQAEQTTDTTGNEVAP